MSYSTGYRRNPSRRPLPSFVVDEHRRGVIHAMATVDLSGFAPPIFDQGPTGACVGHARSRGIFTARGAAGRPMAFVPSPKGIYQIARCYERSSWGAPLEDGGADPVDSIDGVRIWGVKPMVGLPDRYSDCASETVNENPTLGELETSREFRLLDDYQIVETGSARIASVQHALAAGYPVCIDVAGGASQFQDYAGGVRMLTADGAPLDHYVCLVGYNASGFLGHNSWGEEWGYRGTFWADASVIQASADIIVCVERTP